jgi:erythromycin esterase
MNKKFLKIGIIVTSFILISPIINAFTIIHEYNEKNRFNSSICISGKVEFINQPLIFNFEDKSIIPYCPLNFAISSDIIITIDDEILELVSGGNIYILGYIGRYNLNESDDGKTFVNLDGKALYVKINAMQYSEIDDSYIPVVQSLDNITNSLDESPLELSDEDLECLAYLSDCKIVGLGEATHGTKEFFQLKHRIFRYLVENYGYKIFAFECDMGESYYIDNYVTNKGGDIDDIMINKMHFWTWSTNEVKDLLIWMKEYNEDKSYENKIHFIGVDCQYLTFQSDIIIDYFNRSNVSLSNDCLNFLYEIKQFDWNLLNYYSDINLTKKKEIDKNVDILLAEIEEQSDELISASSEYEYRFIKQIGLNIKQVNDFYYFYAHESIIKRDYYMAENSIWTSKLFDENTKVALWAHNGHTRNDETYSGYGSMGFYLKEELEDDYQIVNFAFSFGSFTAVGMKFGRYYLGTNQITRQPLFGSINYIFHYAQDDNFILRKIDIPNNSSFDRWISDPQQILDIGALFTDNSYIFYHNIDFKEQCDILIYWDETLASELLNPQIHSKITNIFLTQQLLY